MTLSGVTLSVGGGDGLPDRLVLPPETMPAHRPYGPAPDGDQAGQGETPLQSMERRFRAVLPGPAVGWLARCYFSLAFRVISVAASALETGQPFLAPSAISWNLASSMSGTSASVSSSILVMPKPPSTGLR